MSTEIQSDVTKKPEVSNPEGSGKPHTAGKKKGLNYFVFLLLIAAIAVAVIAAWQWFEANSQIKDLQKEFEKLVLEVDSRLIEVDSSNKEITNITDEVRESREEIEAKIKLLETNLTESINRQETLEELYQNLAPSRDEVTMEEVEQLLLIANQQLQIANNVKSALIAMQEANVRLQRINHPQLFPVRSALTKDINLLKALPKVDTMDISLRLENLAEAVDKLPLIMEIRPSISDTPPSITWIPDGALSEFFQEIWNDIKQLVRIQHVDKQNIPPPSHSYFLRENLKLRLLSAHNALLARDTINFKTNLKISIEWINKYYDNKSKLTISMLETLRQLHDKEINIELPNISSSYDAIRKYRLAVRKKTVSINSNSAKHKRMLENAGADKNDNKLIESASTAESKAKVRSEAEAGRKTETKTEIEIKVEEKVETESKNEMKLDKKEDTGSENDVKVGEDG